MYQWEKRLSIVQICRSRSFTPGGHKNFCESGRNCVSSYVNSWWLLHSGRWTCYGKPSHLANDWMSRFDPVIKSESAVYERCMDDILTEKNRETNGQCSSHDLQLKDKWTIEYFFGDGSALIHRVHQTHRHWTCIKLLCTGTKTVQTFGYV